MCAPFFMSFVVTCDVHWHIHALCEKVHTIMCALVSVAEMEGNAFQPITSGWNQYYLGKDCSQPKYVLKRILCGTSTEKAVICQCVSVYSLSATK